MARKYLTNLKFQKRLLGSDFIFWRRFPMHFESKLMKHKLVNSIYNLTPHLAVHPSFFLICFSSTPRRDLRRGEQACAQ